MDIVRRELNQSHNKHMMTNELEGLFNKAIMLEAKLQMENELSVETRNVQQKLRVKKLEEMMNGKKSHRW